MHENPLNLSHNINNKRARDVAVSLISRDAGGGLLAVHGHTEITEIHRNLCDITLPIRGFYFVELIGRLFHVII